MRKVFEARSVYEILGFAATLDKRSIMSAACDLLARRRGAFDADDESRISFHYYSDDEVLRWVVYRDFRCFAPKSWFSLTELERRLAEREEGESGGEIDVFRFATTPIVLVMSPPTYSRLRQAGPAVGWRTLYSGDVPVKLMHAQGQSADGLAVMAAAALSERHQDSASRADPDRDGQDRFIAAMESKVIEYGPDDASVGLHGLPGGDWRADVLAIQERTAFELASHWPDLPLVVVHPDDGTMWVDQVACRMPSASPFEQRATEQLVRVLRDPAMQPIYASAGLRPAQGNPDNPSDPSWIVTGQPLSTLNNVEVVGTPSPPRTSPPRRLLRTLTRSWSQLKKVANVALVLDVSGSMAGRKLDGAKRGVRAFLDTLEGPDANVCLILFATNVQVKVPSQSAGQARQAVLEELDRAQADGGTALLDAIDRGLDLLDDVNSTGNLKALVVLTDGEENSSSATVTSIQRRLGGSDCIFFGIAYGSDADQSSLQMLARNSGGHSLVTDESNIQAAYEQLSQHL